MFNLLKRKIFSDTISPDLILGKDINFGQIYFDLESSKNNLFILDKDSQKKGDFLLNLISQSIKNSQNIIFSSDQTFIEHILHNLDNDNLDDSVIIEIGQDTQLSLNLLNKDLDEDELINLTYILSDIFPHQIISETFYHIFKSYLYTIAYTGGQLSDLIPLIQDHNFRSHILSKIKIEPLSQFWSQYLLSVPDHQLMEINSIIINKISHLIQHELIGNLLGGQKNILNIEQLIKQQNIIINLDKRYLGNINSNLINALILFKLFNTHQFAKSQNITRIYSHDSFSLNNKFIQNILLTSKENSLSFIFSHSQLINDYNHHDPLDYFSSFALGNINKKDIKYFGHHAKYFFNEDELINNQTNIWHSIILQSGATHPYKIIHPINGDIPNETSALREKLASRLYNDFLLN